MKYLRLLIKCSLPTWSFSPQWKWICSSLYFWSFIGPPLMVALELISGIIWTEWPVLTKFAKDNRFGFLWIDLNDFVFTDDVSIFTGLCCLPPQWSTNESVSPKLVPKIRITLYELSLYNYCSAKDLILNIFSHRYSTQR